jgi:hypothetical protein
MGYNARELIIHMIAGEVTSGGLYEAGARVADEILAKHVTELTHQINRYERVIEADQFSNQEDAYYAGLRDAVRILEGDMDEPE